MENLEVKLPRQKQITSFYSSLIQENCLPLSLDKFLGQAHKVVSNNTVQFNFFVIFALIFTVLFACI